MTGAERLHIDDVVRRLQATVRSGTHAHCVTCRRRINIDLREHPSGRTWTKLLAQGRSFLVTQKGDAFEVLFACSTGCVLAFEAADEERSR